MVDNMIYGIAGTFGSGKDTVAKQLAGERNLLFISTSDMVRKIALEQKGSVERPVLREVATEIRNKYGGGILAEKSLDEFYKSTGYKGVVVTGIRSLGEVKSITDAGGKIIFVDADIKIRYERMVQRARDQESLVSFEEFAKRENIESAGDSNDKSFNIMAISKIADITIVNNKGIKELFDQVQKLV